MATLKEEMLDDDNDYHFHEYLQTEIEEINNSSFPLDLEFKVVKGKYELFPVSLCRQHGWSSLQGKPFAKIRANNSTGKRQAIDVLNLAFNDTYKDVKIICKDNMVVECHKVILSRVSEFLELLLSHEGETIFLPDYSFEVVAFLLKICYFVDVESSVDEDFASELQNLVKSLEIDLSTSAGDVDRGKGLKRKRTFNLHQHSFCQKCEMKRKYAMPSEKAAKAIKKEEQVANTVMLIKCISCNNSIGITVENHNRVQAHVQKSNPGKSMRYQCEPCVTTKKEPYSAMKPRPSSKDSEQSLLCWNCGAMYSSQEELKKHIDEHFKTHKCVDCGKEFEDKNELVKHTSTVHMSGIPKCSLCPERVTIGMEMHMKYHHSGMEGHKKCDFCSFEAFNGSSLMAHKKRCHGISPSPKKPTSFVTRLPRPSRVEDRSEDFKVQCDQCPMQLKPESLHYHLENHHNPDLPFECGYCQYRSATELSVKLHETKEHFKTKFVENGEMLESKKKLDEILESELESGSKVKCDLCPQVCDSNLISKHVEEHHNPNLPFGCKFCGFRSLFGNGVKLHENKYHYELKHGRERPVILCENGCGKDFGTLFNMKRHLKRRCRLSSVKEHLIRKEKDSKDYHERYLKLNARKKERRDKLRKFQLEYAV